MSVPEVEHESGDYRDCRLEPQPGSERGTVFRRNVSPAGERRVARLRGQWRSGGSVWFFGGHGYRAERFGLMESNRSTHHAPWESYRSAPATSGGVKQSANVRTTQDDDSPNPEGNGEEVTWPEHGNHCQDADR
jgi:hypothetical protein